MLGVKPCPYCDGEVEVVKLNKKHNKDAQLYRIQCQRCHALVAKGTKFECETDEQGAERIRQYEAEIKRIWAPNSCNVFRQTLAAQQRDAEMAYSSRMSLDDEEYEVHDASHRLN